MPAVTQPVALDVIRRCGLSRYAEGYVDDNEFQAAIEELIEATESEVALEVGESFFDLTTHTARKAQAIQNAWMDWTAANWLIGPYVRKVTGTHEPLLVEDSEQFLEGARFLLARARNALQLVQIGMSETPFARPAVGASTFTVADGDRVPSARNRLIDTSDDVSAFDVENG